VTRPADYHRVRSLLFEEGHEISGSKCQLCWLQAIECGPKGDTLENITERYDRIRGEARESAERRALKERAA
jgi:hypothetical protein